MKFFLLFIFISTILGIVEEIKIFITTKKYSKGKTYRGLESAFTYRKGEDGNYYLMD